MQRIDRFKGLGGAARFAVLAGVLGLAVPAAAQQGMMQLDPPAPSYTLGRFHYEAPKLDGWRQIANQKDTLALVYAEQKTPETIETLFGVTLEAHDIPEGTQVESAEALADLSRRQMIEQRGKDVVAFSPVEAVPSIDNFYKYRLLVHAPVPNTPDGYEVYYVMMSPDKTQYVVIQCITKTQDYANDAYFTQFVGSLTTLKYQAPAPADKDAAAPAAAKAPEAASPPAP